MPGDITVSVEESRKLQCAASLGEACTLCGGRMPDLTMTLAEFIDQFGPNQIEFRYTGVLK